MAEYYAGKITIGGKMPKSLRGELIVQLGEDGLRSTLPDNELLEHLDSGADWLVFSHVEARYGMFKYLEHWLKDNKIDFDRHSAVYSECDATIEFDAMMTYCRGGVVSDFYASTDGTTTLMDVNNIHKFIDKYEGLVVSFQKSGILVSIDDVGAMLTELKKIAAMVPKLEHFKWVD